MADAKMNKTSTAESTPAAGTAADTTTTSTGGDADGGAATAPAVGVSAPRPAKPAPKFYVDGQSVGREQYLKEAEKRGLNPAILQEKNFYPSL